MLLIIVAACSAIFAIAGLLIILTRPKSSKRVNVRLAALDQELSQKIDDGGGADIRRKQRKLSAIPWLNQWLSSINLASASSLYFYQAGVTYSLGAVVLASIACAAVSGMVVNWRFEATVPALLASAFALTLPFLYIRRKRAKRLNKLEQLLPEALGMMVSALRVGHSLIASLGAVAQESVEPIAGEMRKCFEEQNYGLDLRTALTNLVDRAPIQDFRIFVAAVLIQKESGGNLAEVLEKVAQTTRERFRLKKQVTVHTAQGRMTGWVLSILPIVLGFGMYLMNPQGMSVLWKTSIGLKMLYGGIAMDVVGALIIRKIVGIRV